MLTLAVVDDPKDWPLRFQGAELVAARSYLVDQRFTAGGRARVFNLCRSYRYQSTGYYVSLLAAARGHKPLPSIATIQDLKQHAILRVAADDLDDLIHKSLASIKSSDFVLSIYFGRNLAQRHDALSQRLFKLFPAPFLRAQFSYHDKLARWQLHHIAPLAASEIPPEHVDFVLEVSQAYFAGRSRLRRPRSKARFDLAILHNPDEPLPPSNQRALRRFAKAAENEGFATEMITKADYGRLAEFDALFIRETTAVHHHTYRFARRAAAEGLVVIDDPDSILYCTNKVFLAELMARAGVPTPRTLIVHRGNAREVATQLGLPCILKRPDSSFSQGVVKVDTVDALKSAIDHLLTQSELVIAQEFMPTPFDWRVTLIDRTPLFVCRYYMASHHWQIVKHDGENGLSVGDSDTLTVADAPPAVVKLACRAANLIGGGFYGVDIKQVGGKLYVIEVNDNPSLDAGAEDEGLGNGLYTQIMQVMLKRVEQRKERTVHG